MAGSEATQQSFDQMEFTTGRGLVVRGKALELASAMKIMRMLDNAGSGTQQADLIEAFLAATGIGPECRATAGEMIGEVIPHFLSCQGITPPATPPSTGAGTT